MVGFGALIGVVNIVIDEYLVRRGAAWRAPVLAVAVGIYLPLELEVPMLLGGIISALTVRRASGSGRHGLLLGAGLITGEARVGILMAIPIVVSGDPNVLALPFSAPAALGAVVAGAVAVWLYLVAARDREL